MASRLPRRPEHPDDSLPPGRSPMMQPPSLEHPTSTAPSVPRYRRWAVHLAIVVACIGSVATSPSATSPQVIAEYEGPPLGLTTRATTATRHFKVRVSVQ